VLEHLPGANLSASDFASVVNLIYVAVVSEEEWCELTIPDPISIQACDVIIRLVLSSVPFARNTQEQLYELSPQYLLLVLYRPYLIGPNHGYPERYAEVLAKDVNKFHRYQKLMAKEDKYAAQAHIEDNYIELAKEEIEVFVTARDSFNAGIKSWGPK